MGAENLNDVLTVWISRCRMRIAPSVCQLVDFRMLAFLPTFETNGEYDQEVRFAIRRLTTKIKAAVTIIVAGMSPTRA